MTQHLNLIQPFKDFVAEIMVCIRTQLHINTSESIYIKYQLPKNIVNFVMTKYDVYIYLNT